MAKNVQHFQSGFKREAMLNVTAVFLCNKFPFLCMKAHFNSIDIEVTYM
jgi:hypothetical protein